VSEPITSYIIENDKAFDAALKRLGEATNDFRVPFGSISNEFYQSNKKLATLKSAGLYQDLAPSPAKGSGGIKTTSDYAEMKQKKLGFKYPILLGRSGRLLGSILSKSHPEAEHFIGKQVLILGTNVPYAIYHQSDKPRKKIPQRKIVFISGGGKEVAKDSRIAGRKELWLNIINDHIKQLITGEI